ncbi:MAG: hypothetical protein Q8N98_02450 [bacterium]|nr:hypothetical protein [bacterium]
MRKINVTDLILEAQRHLVERPYDLVHDITHHARVWGWCLKIVEAEKLKVNWPVLQVAAWWHDAEGRTGELVEAVKKSLAKHMADKDFTDKVIDLIEEHTFGKTQTSLEAKVLFDADKLEYVTPERFAWFFQALNDGYLNESAYRKYNSDWHSRIKLVPKLLNFSFTKKEFLKMYKKAIKSDHWQNE